MFIHITIIYVASNGDLLPVESELLVLAIITYYHARV